jgi:hypothetical protein
MSERAKDLPKTAARKRGSSKQPFVPYGTGPYRYGDPGAAFVMRYTKHDPYGSPMVHAIRRRFVHGEVPNLRKEDPLYPRGSKGYGTKQYTPLTLYTEYWGRGDPRFPEIADKPASEDVPPGYMARSRGMTHAEPGIERVHIRGAQDAPQSLAHELVHYAADVGLLPESTLAMDEGWQDWQADLAAHDVDEGENVVPPADVRQLLRHDIVGLEGKDITRGAVQAPDLNEDQPDPSLQIDPRKIDVFRTLMRNRSDRPLGPAAAR